MTGDYILSIASIMISRLKNDDVTLVLSQVSWQYTLMLQSLLLCYPLLLCYRLGRSVIGIGLSSVSVWVKHKAKKPPQNISHVEFHNDFTIERKNMKQSINYDLFLLLWTSKCTHRIDFVQTVPHICVYILWK